MMKNIISKIKDKKLYLILSAFLIVLDIISKIYVQAVVKPVIYKPIIGNYLVFIYTENYGVAFGFLNNLPDSIKNIIPTVLLFIVFFAILLVFTILLNLDKTKQRLSTIGFSMIFAGAIGNFVDRLQRGYVTDFVNMGINETIRFNYNYNVADASITVGITIIAIGVFLLKEDFDTSKKTINTDNISKEDTESKEE